MAWCWANGWREIRDSYNHIQYNGNVSGVWSCWNNDSGALDSLITNNECVIKEITGQMTSHMYFLSDNKQQAEVSAYRMWWGEHLQDLNLTVCKFSGFRSSICRVQSPDRFRPSSKTETFFSLDAEPPWIQCPRNIAAETDERRGTANVSWDVPTATDNSKEEVGYFTKQSVAVGMQLWVSFFKDFHFSSHTKIKTKLCLYFRLFYNCLLFFL